jgi:hypothetical protein
MTRPVPAGRAGEPSAARRLVLGVCENDLVRDREFLLALLKPVVDLRLTAFQGPTLVPGAAKLLRKAHEAATRSRFVVSAFLLHVDADMSLDARLDEIEAWFEGSGLRGLAPLIRVVPLPCTEAWLCRAEGRHVRGANPAAGCAPFKRAWRRGGGLDLDRVRAAAGARPLSRLGDRDVRLLLEDWNVAGLPTL